jgi:hypothetical protein
MTNRLSITTNEDNELHRQSGRGLSIIKICKTKKRCGPLLRVIHVGKSRFYAVAETYKRGVAHRTEMHI